MNLDFTHKISPKGIFFYDKEININLDAYNMKLYKSYVDGVKFDFMSKYKLLHEIKSEKKINEKLDSTDGSDETLKYIESRIHLKERLYTLYADIILTITSYLFNEGIEATSTELININENFLSISGYKLSDCFKRAYNYCDDLKKKFDDIVDQEYPLHRFKK